LASSGKLFSGNNKSVMAKAGSSPVPQIPTGLTPTVSPAGETNINDYYPQVQLPNQPDYWTLGNNRPIF
jgi:hypothetical protein